MNKSGENQLPDNFACLPPSQIAETFEELVGRKPSDDEITEVFVSLESDMNDALDQLLRKNINKLYGKEK